MNSERGVQFPRLQAALDVVDPCVAAPLQIFIGEPSGPVGVIEFLCTLAGRPLRLKIRQHTPDLLAADAVAALVGSAIGGVLDAAAMNGFGDDGRQVANPVILLGLA